LFWGECSGGGGNRTRDTFPRNPSGEADYEPRFVGRWNNQWQLTERTRLERAIQDRDDTGCFYCGSTLTRTVDHVDARAAGGGDELGNLVFACRVCNWSKLAAPAWLYVCWVAAFGPCRIKRRTYLSEGATA
jgi:5-methylcytosine-specific restriction endonuclease McrA